ncbi:probable transcription factor At1g11510 [Macadamia integrifolia]|uniref:probable transcription factor At1g11510 n=1 Tax=Macadamia integrifolia TaxID=60698 RepID=UPI001C4E4AF1|nr:probable transcription factor At1g11510 [Macadamia integrifolia]
MKKTRSARKHRPVSSSEEEEEVEYEKTEEEEENGQSIEANQADQADEEDANEEGEEDDDEEGATTSVKKTVHKHRKSDLKGSKRKKKKVADGAEKKPEKKKLFERIWSDEDELTILKGMLNYHSTNGSDVDMSKFHEFIKEAFNFDVAKSQLADKIRRLRKKFINNASRAKEGVDPSFSKHHDTKVFRLSKKLWGNLASPSTKEIDWSLYPHLVGSFRPLHIQPIDWSMYWSFQPLHIQPRWNKSLEEGFCKIGDSKLKEFDQKWKDLGKEEAELLFKRVELTWQQLKLVREASHL